MVEECLKNDVIPGAVERNQEYSMAWVIVDSDNDDKTLPILYDPQTSGGLLIAFPVDSAQDYVDKMKSLGHSATSIIGRIIKSPGSAYTGKVK